jgi:hypothetical protein
MSSTSGSSAASSETASIVVVRCGSLMAAPVPRRWSVGMKRDSTDEGEAREC